MSLGSWLEVSLSELGWDGARRKRGYRALVRLGVLNGAGGGQPEVYLNFWRHSVGGENWTPASMVEIGHAVERRVLA